MLVVALTVIAMSCSPAARRAAAPAKTAPTTAATGGVAQVGSRPLRVLVMGDSLTFECRPAIWSAAAATGRIDLWFASYPGTTLLTNNPAGGSWVPKMPSLITEYDPDVVVAEFSGDYFPPYYRRLDGSPILPGSEDYYRLWAAAAAQATRLLSARHAQVYWTLDPPSFDQTGPDRINAIYLALAGSFPVRFVDEFHPFAGPGGAWTPTLPIGPGGAPVVVRAPDHGHLTEAGCQVWAPTLVDTVLRESGGSG
jgi:lysophospholipase L1-like esterase